MTPVLRSCERWLRNSSLGKRSGKRTKKTMAPSGAGTRIIAKIRQWTHLAEARRSKVTACYNCGQQGHLVKDCPHYCANLNKMGYIPPSQFLSNREHDVFYHTLCKLVPPNCFTCGETGHFSSSCPQKGKKNLTRTLSSTDSSQELIKYKEEITETVLSLVKK